MPNFIFANNVSTTLAGAVSSSATTITLASTANLPATIPSGQALVITLNDAATRQNFEVLYATARTGATLTVLRAQEGTAALSWLTGDYAYSAPTAGQQQAFGQLAAANTWTGANTFDDPVVIPAATLPDEAVNLGQFTSGSNANGWWRKLPDGSITQGGSFNGITTSQTITLPIPFPNNFLQVNATDVGANCFAYGANPVNLSQFNIFISSSAVHSGTWIATGN
jgi:hypothetical protein